jgi:hypothetical protein
LRLLAVAALLGVTTATSAHFVEPILFTISKGRLSAIEGGLVYSKGNVARSENLTMTLSLRMPKNRAPVQIIVSARTGKGIRLSAIQGKTTSPLPLKFEEGFEGINRSGDMEPGYTLRVVEHDFDGDKVPEVVVAVGDGLVNLAVNVFKAAGANTWKRVGDFEGQQRAILERDTIVLPYGSQGLFSEYRWKGGKFVQTNG